MPWRNASALHIYVPPEGPYGDNWVEQVLGSIVKPLWEQYKDHFHWLWITRYSGLYNESALPPPGVVIPARYRPNGNYRFVLFRFSATDAASLSVQEQALSLVAEAGCYADPPGWVGYDVVGDLGSDRFVKLGADVESRIERAKHIVHFVDATVRLMLDSLIQNEKGEWWHEINESNENPYGFFLESVRHLFCNATGVTNTVMLSIQGAQLIVGTYWQRPPLVAISFNPAEGLPSRNLEQMIQSRVLSVQQLTIHGTPNGRLIIAQTPSGEIPLIEVPLIF